MIVVEETDRGVKLRLPAEVDYKLQQEFRKCYRDRPAGPGVSYEIDFQAVISIDSSALGMLLLLRSHCGDDDSDIHLINCNPTIKRVFKIARFNTMFNVD
ncbi:HptB-dependent secretion and biofilm anti anti-sigma factor [Gammaproteobacteria bacterium]